MTVVREKKCSRCKTVKPTSEFYNHKNRRDGLTYWCKQCMQIYARSKYRETRVKGKDYNYTLGIQTVSQLQFSSIVFELPSQNHKIFSLVTNIKHFFTNFSQDIGFFFMTLRLQRYLSAAKLSD